MSGKNAKGSWIELVVGATLTLLGIAGTSFSTYVQSRQAHQATECEIALKIATAAGSPVGTSNAVIDMELTKRLKLKAISCLRNDQ